MTTKLTRRSFLKTTAVALGMPTIIPASALGKNGTVAPSNPIVPGGIGLRRIQAWREENELPDRELMRDGRWLV